MFLLRQDGNLRKLQGFHKGCQVPFQVPRRNVGFLGKCCSVKGPHLAWRGEFLGFCGIMVGSLGFLLSCMGTRGTHLCFLREVRSAFELWGARRDSYCVAAEVNRASSQLEGVPQGSSPFLTLISGFLWSLNRRSRLKLVLRHGTQLASQVLNGVSGHLSSWNWNLRLFLEDATGVSVSLHVVT